MKSDLFLAAVDEDVDEAVDEDVAAAGIRDRKLTLFSHVLKTEQPLRFIACRR